MDAIRKELGESDGNVIDEYRKKIADAHMPEAVQSRPNVSLGGWRKWVNRIAEASMIRTYLDWLLAVPWNKRSEEHLDRSTLGKY
jgi:ATP-dependent Lon protease